MDLLKIRQRAKEAKAKNESAAKDQALSSGRESKADDVTNEAKPATERQRTAPKTPTEKKRPAVDTSTPDRSPSSTVPTRPLSASAPPALAEPDSARSLSTSISTSPTGGNQGSLKGLAELAGTATTRPTSPAASPATSPATSSATEWPNPSPRVTSTPSRSVSTSGPNEADPRPNSGRASARERRPVDDASPMPSADAPPSSRRRKKTVSGSFPAPTWKDDPLREFLVRYDDVDDEVEKPVVDGEAESDAFRRYLAFELESEEYAISIMDVREILSVVSVTPVPRAPEFILGVFSKRGIVMPILDLAAVLNLREPERRMRRSSRVLVVGDDDSVCGLRVDTLHDAVRLREEDIEPVPSGLETKTAMLLDGLGRLGDRMLILLDGDALIGALRTATGGERSSEFAREAS